MDTNTEILEALEILFDDDECAAFGQNVTEVTRIYNNRLSVGNKPVFYSLNPIKPNTRKCDENVQTYRNFLMEIDSLPLDQQMSKMGSVGMPYSVVTYSGGKSYHFILCVEEDLPLELWEHYTAWIHAALPFIDHATKPESVWTRYPNTVRPDTGKIQELQFLGFRYPLATVKAALAKLAPEPPVSTPLPTLFVIPKYKARLRLTTLGCIDGNYIEGRNISLFKAVCDMYRCGYREEEIFDKLYQNFPFDHSLEKNAFDEREFARTIKSAIRQVTKQATKVVAR